MSVQSRLKVGFVSLGCPKNLVDTETMITSLSVEDTVITGDENEADVVVINTCGFLEPAKNESLDTIGEFALKKKKGDLQGLVVAGCMTERYLTLMNEKYPEVDAFIRTGEFSKIKEIVSEIQAQDEKSLAARRALLGEVPHLSGHSEIEDFVTRKDYKRSFAYVKIAEGCNRTCSFCIIPKLRGKLHSRSVEGVVDEIKQLVAAGTREVVFIAQDLTSYGKDLRNGTDLLALLKEVDQIEGLSWYRLMYNYPRFFTDELIDHLAGSEKFSRYLDIPFQHISDVILKKMRRPESSKDIYELIEKLRVRIPGVALRTTLMVGFPGETDQDFEELLKFVETAEFNHLGAFKFYQEKETPSFDLSAQVPEEVKQERYDRLMQLQAEIQKKVQSYFVSETVPVMVDAFSEETKAGSLYHGRHYGQAPEVDGVTYILSEEPLEIGEIYPAQIQKAVGPYDLLASAIVEDVA